MKLGEEYPKIPLKIVATLNDEVLSETTDPDYELQYIDISNVDSLGNILGITNFRFNMAPSRARRIVRDGDVIISTVRTYLRAIAAIENPPENLIVSTGFAVVRPRPEFLYSKYCKYALRDPEFIFEVVSRSVGVSYPAITSMDLATIPIRVPPLRKQHAIVEFLDEETSQIETIINTNELLVKLLHERREALIAATVSGQIDFPEER